MYSCSPEASENQEDTCINKKYNSITIATIYNISLNFLIIVKLLLIAML
jgi:hypothetical protein